MRDISVEESEELPRILGAIAEDAPAAVLGGASALDQAPVDRDLLLTRTRPAEGGNTSTPVQASCCFRSQSGSWD